MPYVILLLIAFGLGMLWRTGPSKQTYALFAAGAVAATVYFMR
jgi:hypothetical protein